MLLIGGDTELIIIILLIGGNTELILYCSVCFCVWPYTLPCLCVLSTLCSRFIKEREQAVAQILAMAPASCRMQAHSDTPPEVDGGPNTPPGMEGSDDEAFTDFIQSLVSDRTDHASLNDCLPLATGTALESTAPL